MTTRRDARRLALQVLFQADVTGTAPSAVEEERAIAGEPVGGFARELVEGVQERLAELDAVIGTHAEGWTVPRMAAVDRAILRLAVYELRFRDDVPASVAVNEAVEAAKELSTEDSSRFVNGILGAVARESPG